MEDFVQRMKKVAESDNIKFKIEKLISSKEAQKTGTCFGTLGLYYDGKFITHEIMPEKKFEKFIADMKK